MRDLSFFLDDLPEWPGSQKLEISDAPDEDSKIKILKFNSHHSTHIDAPFHYVKEGKKLDDYKIDDFYHDCVVLDIKNPNLDLVKERDFVFICTGKSEKIDETYFTEIPEIPVELAKELIKRKISIVGVDSCSPDLDPYAAHDLFLENGIRIVENLAGLKELVNKRFKCLIAPLKIRNSDGAPCRVIAFV